MARTRSRAWAGRLRAALPAVLFALGTAEPAQAQTVLYSDIKDALPLRCYDAASTYVDAADPRRLRIGMNTGIVPGTLRTNAGCYASDDGPTSTMDTISVLVAAPSGSYVSRVTFTQAGSTFSGRGGAGFRGATWVVAEDALTVPITPGGWAATVDLTGLNKTVVPISITTFLAGGGGSSRSGGATASDASLLVEILPLVVAPPPPPPPPPNPVPVTTAVSPDQVTAGGAGFTLTVSGSDFLAASVVRWNDADRPTTAVSSTQLQAAIGAEDIVAAGAASVTVFNPPASGSNSPPDGGLSNAQSVTILPTPPPNPVPSLTFLEPPSAVVGSGTLTLAVNGSNFVTSSVVRWNGTNRTTTFVSSERLTTVIDLNDLLTEGTATVTVFTPSSGFHPPPDGGLSNGLTFTITPVPPAPPPTPGPAPVSAYGNVDDRRGREWRQLTATSGLGRIDAEPLCQSAPGSPHLCQGQIGTVDLTDWVWATSSEVIDLFRAFTTGVSAETPQVGGPEYAPPASQFQGVFGLTQRLTGCTTFQGCFDFRFVGGVTSSTDASGTPVGGGVTLSEELLGLNGGFSVGTISDDGASSRGLFLWRPTGLGAGTTHAYHDTGQSPSPYGGVALDVMSNDWVAGAEATSANALVTPPAVIAPPTDRILVGADGSVQVLAGALAGTYTFPYTLCSVATPSACDQAEVSVVVRSYLLTVANDQAFAPYGTGGVAVNVLANDRLNGAAVTTAVVTLRQLSSSHPGITLNTSTGAVNVTAGTTSGTHTLVYEACEVASPVNCGQATVTLLGRTIDAVNDVFPKLSKDGGISPSVLANDRFNGAVATTSVVQLSMVSALPAGVTLDLATGRFVVAAGTKSGDYPLTYRICEIGNAANCDSASLLLEVSGSGG